MIMPYDIHGLKVGNKNNFSFLLDFLMGLGLPFTFVILKTGVPFAVCIK
jgi:hypothetical protein